MTPSSDSFEAARPATPDDVEQVVTIAVDHTAAIADDRGADLLLRRELAFTKDGLREHFESALAAEDHLLVVGTIDEEVFGYGLVAYERLSDDSLLARLDQILVQSEARGVGVGESIMNMILSEAQDRGCFGIDSRALPGDRHTKNFFESFGLKARQLIVHRALIQPELSSDGP